MILTCPACDTKYVVKDGAIPPAGRQVRCAACKNAWHQDPEMTDVENDDALTSASPTVATTDGDEISYGGPPMPPAHEDAVAAAEVGEVPAQAADEAMISDYSEPAVEQQQHPFQGARFAPLTAGASYGLTAPSLPTASTEYDGPAALNPAAETDPVEHDPPAESWDDDRQFISLIEENDPRSGRGLKIALLLLLLIAAAAAAIWFLAPAAFKERIGLADASATPLEVMLTTSDRQKLASGNELLAISGRVINPTDEEQAVPPIRASLRNRTTRKLVYQWTIAPPARSLPPRGSASFNSAEVDIPTGGDELTVTLGGAAS